MDNCGKYQVGPPNSSSELVNIESVFGCLFLVIDKPGAIGFPELPVSRVQPPPSPTPPPMHLQNPLFHPREEVIEKESLSIELGIPTNDNQFVILNCCLRSNSCSALNLRELYQFKMSLFVPVFSLGNRMYNVSQNCLVFKRG